MQKCFYFILLISTALLSFRANAGFEDLKRYPQNVWDFELTSRYLSTNSNYSSAGGSYNNLRTGNSFALEDFNLYARTTINDTKWAIWGDSQISASQSSTTTGLNTTQNLTATGLTHIRLGSDFILYQDAFSIIPEAYVLYPITTNNFSNYSTPAISDGVTTLSGKVYLQFNMLGIWINGFTGYQWRDQGRAALILYGVIAEKLFKSWWIGANLQGFSSASNDSNTGNSPQQVTWYNSVNGGSALFDSVNPQLLETNAWIGMKFTNTVSGFVGGGTTINGTNIANYWDVQVGLAYRMGSSAAHRPMPRSDVEKFNEETSDGVDQTLFETSRPRSTAPSPQQIRANRPAPVPNNTPPQNIQSELDKTEMQIDMKSFKKTHKADPNQEPNPVEDP